MRAAAPSWDWSRASLYLTTLGMPSSRPDRPDSPLESAAKPFLSLWGYDSAEEAIGMVTIRDPGTGA